MNRKDKHIKYRDKIVDHLILLGFGLGILYWIIQSMILTYTLEGNIIDHLLHLHPDDLLIRLVVILSFTLFGLFLEKKVGSRKREQLRQAYEQLERQTRELAKRNKELNCLYSLSRFTEKEDLSLEQLLQGIVNLIPPACQCPEVTCARIVLHDRTFRTDNFVETLWKQTSDLVVHGQAIGTLEVYYLEEKSARDEGPFSKGEKDLIDAVAGHIGRIIEQRNTEEERRHLSEQMDIEAAKLEAVMQQIPEGVVMARAPSGEIVFGNEQARKILQFPSKRLFKFKNYQQDQYFYPDGRPYQPEELPLARSILKGETVIDEEVRFIRSDGSQGVINVRSSPIRNPGGQIIGGMAIFHDITERRRVEEMSARLAAIVESTEDGIISKTLDGIITSWNGGAEKRYGYSAEEAVGRSISLIFPPERLDELPGILEKLKRGESIEHYETRRLRKDGTKLEVDLTISPLRNKAGRIIGASTIERDITEQKRLEKELQRHRLHLEDLVKERTEELAEANRQLQAEVIERSRTQEALERSMHQSKLILDSAGEGIYGVDLKGNITFINPTALNITGYKADELIGRHAHEILHHSKADGRSYPSEECPIYASMIDGISRYTIEEIFWRKDGSSFSIEYTSAPIREKGRVIGAVVVFKDITEHKRMEDELKESHAQMVAAQRLAHAGSYEWDTATDEISWSEGIYKIFGVENQKMDLSLEECLRQFIHPDDRDHTRGLFQKALNDQEPFEYQHRGIRADGSVCLLQGRAEVAVDAAGNPGKITGFVQDITEFKQAENALRQSEEKYRMIVENAQEGIWVIDAEAKTTFVNSRFAEMIGYTIGEMLGKPIYSFMPEQHVALAQHYFEYRKQDINERHEFELIHKDGSTVYVSLAGTSIFNDNGQFIGAQALVTDITERKRAEEILQKQAKIIDQIHDAVVSTDLDGYVTSWNKGAERLFGYEEKEALGRHIRFLYSQDEQDVLQKRVIRPLKEKGDHEVEVQAIRKTGEKIYLHISLSLMRDNAGNAIGMVGTSMDITERKRAEEEKAKIQSQLLQSQKMEAIGVLAGGVAHDFNNLLTTIQGYNSMAMMKIPDSDPVSGDLNQVKLAARRAVNLTRQLLLFSRRQPMEHTIFNLNSLIDNLLKMLRRLIGEDVTITTELEPHLRPIRADEGTIEQVIMNLAVNARDAMPRGGQLTIRTENITLDEEASQSLPEARPGQFICLSMADTGCGMDKKTIGRIFEPFFTTKETGKGTGLGLSVVYGIVKQHEGWLHVSSEPEQGSVFRVYLPALLAEARVEAVEEIPLHRVQGKGERILVVEDEEQVRTLTVRLLRENNYTVNEASSGQEALDIFEQERGMFDLIVSDVILPDLTGLELVDRLLLARPELKVLLMSGYTDQKSQWRIIKERGFRFLQKPYSLPDLLRALREIIELRALRETIGA